jgi:DNA-binding PucR family transcriptional regulator
VLPWEDGKDESSIPQVTAQIRSAIRSGVRGRGAYAGIETAIGIGRAGAGVQGLHQSQVEATKALNIAVALGRTDEDMSLEMAGVYSLLVDISPQDAAAYPQGILGELIEYDNKHGTDLVSTLEVYLDSFGSAQRTAEALHLHVTSVRYRLSRLEELSGLSLEDPDTRLSIQVALRLRRISI